MKKILFFLVLSLWIAQTVWAGNGSFLILKSAYLYNNEFQTGHRRLTRTKKAYDVVGIARTRKNSLLLRIMFSSDDQTTNGSGYVIEGQGDVQENGETIIKVYPKAPKITDDLTNCIRMSASQLQFTGGSEVSPDFPHIIWKEVNYKALLPLYYWVAEYAGIYRPNKNADWLNDVYSKLEAKKMKSSLKNKILSGLIEKGFTPDWVELSMGPPQKIQPLEESGSVEWHYPNRKVIFKDNKVVQII